MTPRCVQQIVVEYQKFMRKLELRKQTACYGTQTSHGRLSDQWPTLYVCDVAIGGR